MRQTSLDLYKMLEDWIYVAQKTEMDAIEEMSMVIKESIENETKIQSELRIEFMDFTVDQGTLNYITPPPPKYEAREELLAERFSVPQINNIVREFQGLLDIANENGEPHQLRVQFLYQFFKQRLNNASLFSGYQSSLPECWTKLNMDLFMALLRNLDPESSGFIDVR